MKNRNFLLQQRPDPRSSSATPTLTGFCPSICLSALKGCKELPPGNRLHGLESQPHMVYRVKCSGLFVPQSAHL